MSRKYGSNKILILVDGYDLAAQKVQSVSYKETAISERSDGVGDSWEEYSPVGISKAEFSQEGAFFKTDTGGSHDALKTGPAFGPNDPARIVVVGFAGNVVGALFTGAEGAYQHEYEVVGALGTLQRANASYLISGRLDHGVVLHPWSEETADANTEADSADHTAQEGVRSIPILTSSVANPSVITTSVPHGLETGDTVLISGHAGSTPSINGERAVTVTGTHTFTIPLNVTVGGTGGELVEGKTNGGGVGYLEVEDVVLAGYTNAVVTIRDSDDDATFVDLVAFAAVTARGAQRVSVAGAVSRYLAQEVAFTGSLTTGLTPSITYFAGFARF